MTKESKLRAGGTYAMTSLALGALWWLVLFIPEASREELLRGGALVRPVLNIDSLPPAPSVPALLWGFVRVVPIVFGACLLFRRLQRRWPKWILVSAFACLWGGCAVFAMTVVPSSEQLSFLLIAPLAFIAFAWYVVVPMTGLTALTLARLEETDPTARAWWADDVNEAP